jgi:hypothetical protein
MANSFVMRKLIKLAEDGGLEIFPGIIPHAMVYL